MAFISTVPPEAATGVVKELYDRDIQHAGYVANYTQAFSLRPEVMVAWRNLNRVIRLNVDLRRRRESPGDR